jgi:hypothetical protein
VDYREKSCTIPSRPRVRPTKGLQVVRILPYSSSRRRSAHARSVQSTPGAETMTACSGMATRTLDSLTRLGREWLAGFPRTRARVHVLCTSARLVMSAASHVQPTQACCSKRPFCLATRPGGERAERAIKEFLVLYMHTASAQGANLRPQAAGKLLESAMLTRSKTPQGTTGKCFRRLERAHRHFLPEQFRLQRILKFDGTRGPAPLLDSQRGGMPRADARLSRSGPCNSSTSTLGRAIPLRWRNEEKLADVCRSSK